MLIPFGEREKHLNLNRTRPLTSFRVTVDLVFQMFLMTKSKYQMVERNAKIRGEKLSHSLPLVKIFDKCNVERR